MSNLPKNPQPNIENNKPITKPVRDFNYEKVVKEMVELTKKNAAIIKKYTKNPHDETVY